MEEEKMEQMKEGLINSFMRPLSPEEQESIKAGIKEGFRLVIEEIETKNKPITKLDKLDKLVKTISKNETKTTEDAKSLIEAVVEFLEERLKETKVTEEVMKQVMWLRVVSQRIETIEQRACSEMLEFLKESNTLQNKFKVGLPIGMGYKELQEKLEKLNKEWGLDFVSATAGNCCNTCGDMLSSEATERWEEAETYLVVKWFYSGMNYYGEIEDMKELNIKYNIGEKLSIQVICEGIRKELGSAFEVQEPKDSRETINIKRVNQEEE